MTPGHHQQEDVDLFEEDLLEGEDPRVFVSSPDNPPDGRTFVWSSIGWFERIEAGDDTGPVEFSPVARDESELREWLSDQRIEITELDDEFARDVRREFLEQSPLYPEAPELSVQEPDIAI